MVKPWKDEHGVVRHGSLRLISNQTLATADRHLVADLYPRRSTWRFRIREHPGWNELLEVVERLTDSELGLTQEDWQKPTVIKDEVLGGLILDRGSNLYEGGWSFNGQPCTLSIEGSGQDALAEILQAREPILKLPAQAKRIQDAVASLAGLYNDCWCLDGKLLGAEEFLAKTIAVSIGVHPAGEVTLYFDADGLFEDHGIEVQIKESGESISARLA